jgi:protein-S-isoprenylcysteine O-methyltransferase Ste14
VVEWTLSLRSPPIYAGFLVAMLATAITIGTLASYLAVLVGLLAFLMRISSRRP